MIYKLIFSIIITLYIANSTKASVKYDQTQVNSNVAIAMGYLTGLEYSILEFTPEQLNSFKNGFTAKYFINLDLSYQEIESNMNYIQVKLEQAAMQKGFTITNRIPKVEITPQNDPFYILGYITAQKFIDYGLIEEFSEIFLENFAYALAGKQINISVYELDNSIYEYLNRVDNLNNNKPIISLQ